MRNRANQSGVRVTVIVGLAAVAIGVVGVSALAIVAAMRTAPEDSRSVAAGGDAVGTADAIETVETIVSAARMYLDGQKPGRAEAILRAALERLPREQQLRFLLGEALLQQDRLGEAYQEYDRAIIIGPDNAEYRYAAATIAAQIGRLDDAEMHYLAAQRLNRTNPKFPLYLAQVQRKLGYTDEAKKNLLIAAQLDPDMAIAWASLSAIALDENKLSIAMGHIRRARTLEPESVAWRVIEARVLRRDNEPAKAVALLTALPAGVRAANPGLMIELGLSLGLLRRPEDAAGYCIEAFAVRPDIPEYAYQAAMWLERAGKTDRALVFAQQAVAGGHELAGVLLARLAEAE